MRKLFLKITSVLLFLIVILTIYFNTNYYIKSQHWKYKEGKHIGDWDTIDKSQQNYTVVFCYGKSFVIEDVKTGEKGYYENK